VPALVKIVRPPGRCPRRRNPRRFPHLVHAQGASGWASSSSGKPFPGEVQRSLLQTSQVDRRSGQVEVDRNATVHGGHEGSFRLSAGWSPRTYHDGTTRVSGLRLATEEWENLGDLRGPMPVGGRIADENFTFSLVSVPRHVGHAP